MRIRPLLLLALPLSLLGCPEADQALDREAEAITTAVPRAGMATELQLLRGQINLHKRMQGSYPESLESMSTFTHLKYPGEYDYDPSTGTVKSRRFPGL